MFTLFAGALVLSVASLPDFARAAEAKDFLEQFDTLYNHLVIEKRGSVVEMRSVARRMVYRESAIDLADPEHLLVPYTEGLFVAAVFQPVPKKVLMLGLGGGGFNRVFNHFFSGALLRTVEIDKRVQDLARKHMAFQETDKNQVVIMDARMYVKRHYQDDKYDWIILDAYKGNWVPPHLKTQEFYQEVTRCLQPDGVVVINLQNDSKLFDFDVATLNKSFAQVLYFQVPKNPNVIAIAAGPARASLRKSLSAFNRRTLPEGLTKRADIQTVVGVRFDPTPAKDARVMTDDFAPADYYRTVERPRTADR